MQIKLGLLAGGGVLASFGLVCLLDRLARRLAVLFPVRRRWTR